MKYVYLDLNVFDKIEKLDRWEGGEKSVYSTLRQQILSEEIVTPYSNAHINDLMRGYDKNPSYIEKHIETIRNLSKNLCLVQYWGNKGVTWHYRSIDEFFKSILHDQDSQSSESFEDLMSWDETGIARTQMSLMKMTPMSENFRAAVKSNPLLKRMYPNAVEHLTMYALCEDIYNLNNTLKKDYTLYKAIKTLINQSRMKFKQEEKVFKEMDKGSAAHAKSLDFDESFELYAPKSKTSDNPIFQNITNQYFKKNFQGFKADHAYQNSIDDSLHVFYGAQCDYFLTNDDKCLYKAKEIYNELKIKTIASTPLEYVNALGAK